MLLMKINQEKANIYKDLMITKMQLQQLPCDNGGNGFSRHHIMNALFPISFYKQTMMDPSSKISRKKHLECNDGLIKVGRADKWIKK